MRTKLMTFKFYPAPSDNFLRILPGAHKLGGARQDTLALDPSAFAVFQLYDNPITIKQSLAKAIKELEQKRRQSKNHAREEE